MDVRCGQTGHGWLTGLCLVIGCVDFNVGVLYALRDNHGLNDVLHD